MFYKSLIYLLSKQTQSEVKMNIKERTIFRSVDSK